MMTQAMGKSDEQARAATKGSNIRAADQRPAGAVGPERGHTALRARRTGLSASQRVVQQLCDLATCYGIDDGGAIRIDLHLTQDDLASLSGTTRETVNRVLSNLRDQGLIRVERARVSVLKMQQLEDARE